MIRLAIFATSFVFAYILGSTVGINVTYFEVAGLFLLYGILNSSLGSQYVSAKVLPQTQKLRK